MELQQHMWWVMAGCPQTQAAQREAFRLLAASSERREVDRARAILLSLDGWTSFRIAAAFSVKPDTVRQ